jgi:ATP/ADP translocase
VVSIQQAMLAPVSYNVSKGTHNTNKIWQSCISILFTKKVILVDNIWNYEYYSFPDVWGNITLNFLYSNTLVENWGTEYT